MQKLMTVAAAALALSAVAGTALAADVTTAAPVADWNGFYAAALAGYGWGDSSTRWNRVSYGDYSNSRCADSDSDTTAYNGCGAVDVNPGGFTGALEGGYDLQRGNFVIGAVLDLGYMDLSGSARDGTNPRGYRKDTRMSLDPGFFGAAALRAGVSLGDVLVYGKGGGAFYAGEARVDDSCVSGEGCGPGRIHASDDGFRTGWTLGAGAEYRLDESWTLKAEYDYYDFGSTTVSGHASYVYDGTTFGGVKESWKNELTVQTLMAGVGYRF